MDFKIKLPTLKVTKEELINDLIKVSDIIDNKTISKSDYAKYGKFAYSTFRNHFGNWEKALETAGLNRSRNWGSSDEDLLLNLKDVWIKLGRQPKYKDMVIPFSKYSSTAYAHFFGNWTNALIQFKTFLEKEDVEIDYSLIEKNKANEKHKTQRNPNWRLRFKVMQRDHFKCVACGKSPSTDVGVELQIDHIIPWSKGGETTIENLQTLCKICNIGKGNLE